jgi:hypothetical protein
VSIKVTPPQKAFLRSYLPDLGPEIADPLRLAIAQGHAMRPKAFEAVVQAFIDKVCEVSFDGSPDPGHARLALNLQAKGLLQNVDVHSYAHVFRRGSVVACSGLYVEFTRSGAQALYELMVEDTHKDAATVE